MHDKREFAATTEPGEMLDPTRLLVASTSNFGAPRCPRRLGARGAILSLATDARRRWRCRAEFASRACRQATLDGAVQLYTAQAPSFLNRFPNPEADTADMPAVSNPLGISVNNAFGRPGSPTRRATGARGIGVESVLDPDGRPLAEAPSERAGGVFAGHAHQPRRRSARGRPPGRGGRQRVPRAPRRTPRGGRCSPSQPPTGRSSRSTSRRASTAWPRRARSHRSPAGAAAVARLPTRVGMVFNWVPDRFLYVADPGNDAILQLRLDDDFHVFKVAETRRLQSP